MRLSALPICADTVGSRAAAAGTARGTAVDALCIAASNYARKDTFTPRMRVRTPHHLFRREFGASVLSLQLVGSESRQAISVGVERRIVGLA
jgi:hypothetical protein